MRTKIVPKMKFAKIACGISGGVDSSVAAYLLTRKGFDVVGVFMRNWDQVEENGICSSDKDLEDGRHVCQKLGIPLVEVNFVKEYWNLVFNKLLEEYSCGLTPNPDMLCNRHIKFDAFEAHCVRRLGVDAIATGHYARTSFGPFLESYRDQGTVRLLRPKDSFQDQTFFLSRVPQKGLRRCLFPLGEHTKAEVRHIASQIGLHSVASKKASTGICFVGPRNFRSFIREYLDDRPGDFVDVDTGRVVGHHYGIHQWTVGQRCRIRGLDRPYFVASKDCVTGDIYVAPGHDHPILYSTFMETANEFWIEGSRPSDLDVDDGALTCNFRFQHTYPLVRCRIERTATDGRLRVRLLDGPLRALTPGQYAVFYDEDVCLGSAQIVRVDANT